MRLAGAAVVLGSLILVLGFGLGVDTPISATVAGRSYACADVIGPAYLVSGQLSAGRASADGSTAAERRSADRVDAACAPLETGARWAVWGGLAVGGLLLLAGWTAFRERDHELVLRAAAA